MVKEICFKDNDMDLKVESPDTTAFKIKVSNAGIISTDNGSTVTTFQPTVPVSSYSESLSESSTTLTDYQDKVTLVFDPPATGDYIVMGCASVKVSSIFTSGNARLENVTDTVTIFETTLGTTYYPYSAFTKVSCTQGVPKTFKIQWNVSNSSYTAYIKNARIYVRAL